MHRVANIEHPDPRVEVSARQRGRFLFVVHAAIMTAIHKRAEPGKVRDHSTAVGYQVRFQPQFGNDFRIGLVTDIDDPGKWERRQPCLASNMQVRCLGEACGSRFIDEDNVRFALDLDRYGVLGAGSIRPEHLANETHLGIRYAGLDLAQIVDQQAVISVGVRTGDWWVLTEGRTTE